MFSFVSFDLTNGANKVCHLKKVLYGLKQLPRLFSGRLTKAMACLGYKQNQVDHNMFFKHSKGGKLIVLLFMLMILLLHDII